MKIKVVYRKLGREKAWGLAHADNVIEIDERLKGKKEMEIILHESLHCLNPTFSESRIINDSKTLANVLWKLGYRKINS